MEFTHSSLIQIFMVFTAVFVIWHCNLSKRHHQILATILVCNLVCEIICTVLKSKEVNHNLFLNAGTIIHHTLWLTMLYVTIHNIKMFQVVILVYVSLASVYVFILNNPHQFSTYAFISGALIYIAIFLYTIIYHLFKENFSFFSNNVILLCAPLLLLIGFSCVFAFEATILYDTLVIGKWSLYDLISTFVNAVYYTLINIYI